MKVINKYISVSDKAVDDAGEMYLYGDIVDEKWWDEEVSPKSVRDSLNGLGTLKNLNIHLNSYGGSCIAGNAIISILDNYRRKNGTALNVYIEGIAASMGSGIASVGDKVYMADNALFMVHLPSTLAIGNKEDFQQAINILEKTEETLVANYMRRFKGTEDELKGLMEQESWLTADEAKEWGFVDEIVEGVKVAASAKGIRIGDQVFENKVADMIKSKYPNMNFEKEEKKLTYDEKLGQFGITQEMFDSLNLESEKVLELANMVANATKTEPETPFISKDTVASELGKEDITAEEVLNYAKAGMHPEDTTEISKKAQAFDKVLASAKATALANAMKAMGNTYNEGRMKKYLDVLDYDEIVEQSDAWLEQAKKALNAGKRTSARSDFKPLSNNDDAINNYQFFDRK